MKGGDFLDEPPRKPKTFATVNVEEAQETLIYVRIDPEVVKRIENIERMLKYIYDRDFGK